MYFELVKEVIKFILNSDKNTLQIFSFYKKQALKNILNNFEVYYQIQRVHTPGKEHLWKEYKHVVTIRDNLAENYVNKYRTYEEAAAKVLWLQAEDKRLNRTDSITYRILGYMSYVASDVEHLSSSTDYSLLNEELCEVPKYIDKDYIRYEEPSIFFD